MASLSISRPPSYRSRLLSPRLSLSSLPPSIKSLKRSLSKTRSSFDHHVSSHSRSTPYCKYDDANASVEYLVPKKRLRFEDRRLLLVRGGVKGREMTIGAGAGRHDYSQGSGNERRMSYGIGGAGNIRRPSEVIYPIRTNADGSRRRSSVWSSITTTSPGTSPEGKRSLMSLFRRGSVARASSGRDEKVEGEGSENDGRADGENGGLRFNPVDLGGKKVEVE